MDYTQVLGNINELNCLMSFILLGYECSVPYGNGAKYDFIADIDGDLKRIQCKASHYTNEHGQVSKESFSFDATSSSSNTKETKRHKYTSDLIDYFATHFNGKTYVIPVTECSTHKTLRFSPPKNGNKKYNKAEDYLIENLFQTSKLLMTSKEAYINRNNL